MEILYLFIASVLISLITTYLIKKFAIKYNIGVLPQERMIHQGFKPLLGGIGIFAGFISGILFSLLLNKGIFIDILKNFSGLLIASLLIVFVGIYDDKKGLNASKKFFFQFLAATIVIFDGFIIKSIQIPSAVAIPLGIMAVPVTYLWIIGISNAINLLDGLDGLAGGVSLIISAGLLAVVWPKGDFAMIVVLVSLCAGLIGFLRYNIRPASIFMGDAGSLFLGLILSVLSVKVFSYSNGRVDFIAPIILLGIPIGDTVLAFFRRLNKGKHPFQADKDHLHHRLIDLGLSHGQTVYLIYLLSAMFVVVVYVFETASSLLAVVSLSMAIIISLLGLRRLGYLETKRKGLLYGDQNVFEIQNALAPLSARTFLHVTILIFVDILMVNIALIVTVWLRFKLGLFAGRHLTDIQQILTLPLFTLLTISWISLFFINNLYNMRWDISRFDKIKRISKVILFGLLVFFILSFDPQRFSLQGAFIYGFFMIFFVNFGRMLIITFEKHFSKFEYAPHNTLLVGNSEKGRKLLREIRNNPHLLYNVIGFVTDDKTSKSFSGLPFLGLYKDISSLIRQYKIEEIIIAIRQHSRDEILNIVSYAGNIKVSFKIIPDMYDVVSGHKTEEIIGHPLIRLFPDHMFLWQKIIKRIIDIIISLFLLIILTPFWLLIVLVLAVRGISPVFQIFNMVGKGGEIYGMLNFNYGSREKNPVLYKLIHDSYLYKMPALINILFGKMSLVGPRPESPETAARIRKKIKFYNRRFQVKPGLTGWSQVRFRYSDSMKSQREMLKHDLFYLENFSISFDVRIILRSLFLFFFRITK